MLFFPCHSAYVNDNLYANRYNGAEGVGTLCAPVALCVLESECFVGLKLVIL